MNSLPTDAEHYKALSGRHYADSQRYQAQLFHAYESLRQQAKGLKRQAMRIKRLRFQVAALKAQLAYLEEIELDSDRAQKLEINNRIAQEIDERRAES